MKKLNKKGFTLVELLAVIVVLALLMVVLANTALPALNKSKHKSLRIYAQRVQEKAKEVYMSTGANSSKSYTIGALMGGNMEQYYGYVTVDYTNNDYVATVYVIDIKNNIGMNGVSLVNDSTTVVTATNTSAYTNASAITTIN